MQLIGGYACFAVDNPQPIIEVMPDIRRGFVQGKHIIAVPHTTEHMALMRGFGLAAPSPILERYDWPGKFKPFKHQIETARFLAEHNRAFLLSGMGTGKTASALWAADYLMHEGVIKRCLIAAPLSCLERVWGDALYQNFPHRKFVVLHGTRQARLALIKQDWDFAIVNHHGLGIIGPELPLETNLLIFDEIAVFRNHNTKLLYGEAKKLMTPSRWAWGLTGSPTPNAPTDAWALSKLLTPERYNGSFTRFKMETMYQVSQFKWAPRRNAEEMVNHVLQPSIRYALEDCVGLPPTIYQERQAALSQEQQLHYLKLKREAMTEVGGTQITAVNSAVLLNKLVQASCIAKDTPVLTNRGWVAIQDVGTTDLLWDGVEWTSHEGVINKGTKDTVYCGYIRLTKDHKLLTTQGWRAAEEFQDEYARKRFNWAKVRFPDSYMPPRLNSVEELQMRDMVMPLRLREQGSENQPELAKQKSTKPTALRLPHRNMADPRQNEAPAISYMEQYKTSMFKPIGQGLQKLWSTGYIYLHAVGGFIRELLQRSSWGVQQRANIRARRQQWPVRPRKLQVGNAKRTSKQQTDQCIYRNTKRTDDSSSSCGVIFTQSSYAACTHIPVQVASGEGFDYTPKRGQVFDILNSGPRNRFVVRADNGTARIVHNCGCIYGANSAVAEIDFGPRLEVLKECIDESGGKCLVFVPLTGVLHALYEKLKRNYSCAVVEGATSASKRNEIFKQFQESPNPRVLLANPATMAHGLTLTAAATTIWYAPITSHEYYCQANARMTRPGQTKTTNIIHISAASVEHKLYQALKERGRFQDCVLELAKER